MTKNKITIQANIGNGIIGDLEIDCFQDGYLAVHKDSAYNTPPYTITHIPSGLALLRNIKLLKTCFHRRDAKIAKKT